MSEKTSGVPTENSLQADVVVEQRTIRGNAARGQRPHVCIDQVKYTNALLASMPAAVGRILLVRIDQRDMRSVHGYLETGEDIGVLSVTACGLSIHTREPSEGQSQS